MKIVHIATSVRPTERNPTKRELELESAHRWLKLQEHANYRKALNDHRSAIENIRIRDKNFTPVKA